MKTYEAALSLDKTDIQARENLAFVKKLKANPPPETPRNQQDKENKKEQNEEGDQGKSEPEQQQKGAQNQQQDGKRDSDQEKTGNSQPPPPKQSAPPEPRRAETSGDATDKKNETSPDEETLRQAEKMLNRLQDQPGRAMIPALPGASG